MLLLKRESITEQNIRVNILEVGVLAKPEDLIMKHLLLIYNLLSEYLM